MSYNGSGTFQINTSGQPVVAGTVISSTAFNALTADLATGLSTAITKDGQTTTTARIPFAAGINSTLVTDSTNSTSGSIITAGGVGIAKALYVGTNANIAGTLGVTGVATFSAAPIYSSLTASSAVATDASKALVSVTNTGTGNNVLATSPTLVTPVLGAASATSITVNAGAVGTPSITTTGDTNTGIFFPAADTIAFSEGGVESARIDSAGNFGLGVTPSAWASGWKALQLANGSSFVNNGATNYTGIFQNAYYNGTNSLYLSSTYALKYELTNGTHAWYTSGAGTAGNAISFTQAMTLDASGNLLVGTTSSSFSSSGRGLVEIAGSSNALLSLKGGSALAYIHNTGTDLNIQNNSVGALLLGTNSAERARIDSSGNLGIGSTTQNGRLTVKNPSVSGNQVIYAIQGATSTSQLASWDLNQTSDVSTFGTDYAAPLAFKTNSTERARIDSSGNFFVGKTTTALTTAGITLESNGVVGIGTNTSTPMFINRQGDDGNLIEFRQANTAEGSISVSGTTVSYNGGHLSRWAQTNTAKDDTLVKGTVLSNLDEMNVYTDAEGNPVDNEQLNKVKVSDVEGDANVAGVFVNWSHDEDHDVDEINMAMTGDMIIRIAQNVTVSRGDLLMSAGDGTAKPQGDDIVRSKTVAKVTSTHVTCTYADGSFCVPCVLMAC